MKQGLIAAVLAGGLMVSVAGGALADAQTNPTLNDSIGYCTSNHNKHFKHLGTVGSFRRVNLGAQAEANEQIRTPGTPLNTLCTTTQTPSP